MASTKKKSVRPFPALSTFLRSLVKFTAEPRRGVVPIF